MEKWIKNSKKKLNFDNFCVFFVVIFNFFYRFYTLLALFEQNLTYLESNYVFNIVKGVEYATQKEFVDLEEFTKIFLEYDFIDLEDPASHILMDIKVILFIIFLFYI